MYGGQIESLGFLFIPLPFLEDIRNTDLYFLDVNEGILVTRTSQTRMVPATL